MTGALLTCCFEPSLDVRNTALGKEGSETATRFYRYSNTASECLEVDAKERSPQISTINSSLCTLQLAARRVSVDASVPWGIAEEGLTDTGST